MREDQTLPVRSTDLSNTRTDGIAGLHTYRGQVLHPCGSDIIELQTDSEKLLHFFSSNWRPAPVAARAKARVIALKQTAEKYGFNPRYNKSRWYCTKTQQLLYFGHESYANLKVSTRGVLSRLAVDPVIWLHGCGLSVEVSNIRMGLLILGCSGAGKTTLTANLKNIDRASFQITNDDWGAYSVANRKYYYTGEEFLHMKYLTLDTLRPEMEFTPLPHQSEHFHGDRRDPMARALVRRGEVFSDCKLADQIDVDYAILLQRAEGTPPGVARISPEEAAKIVAEGEYSKYYGAKERFFDGSLLLFNSRDEKRHRDKLTELFSTVPVLSVGNVETPATVVQRLINFLKSEKASDIAATCNTKVA